MHNKNFNPKRRQSVSDILAGEALRSAIEENHQARLAEQRKLAVVTPGSADEMSRILEQVFTSLDKELAKLGIETGPLRVLWRGSGGSRDGRAQLGQVWLVVDAKGSSAL